MISEFWYFDIRLTAKLNIQYFLISIIFDIYRYFATAYLQLGFLQSIEQMKTTKLILDWFEDWFKTFLGKREIYQ